jgi:hypothetical protein
MSPLSEVGVCCTGCTDAAADAARGAEQQGRIHAPARPEIKVPAEANEGRRGAESRNERADEGVVREQPTQPVMW